MILYSKQAIKALKGTDRVTATRIHNAIEAIPKGNILPLKGVPGAFRLRVGDWRVVFRYKENNTISVDRIAPRGEVYKGV